MQSLSTTRVSSARCPGRASNALQACKAAGCCRSISRPPPLLWQCCVQKQQQQQQQLQRRCFAAAARQSPPRPFPRPSAGKGASKGSGNFAKAVPDVELWTQMQKSVEAAYGMDPDAAPLEAPDAISLSKQWCQAVLAAGKGWWSGQAQKSRFNPSHLHFIGSVMMASPLSSADIKQLGHHILETSSLLRCPPAMVTILGLALADPPALEEVDSEDCGIRKTEYGNHHAMISPHFKAFRVYARTAEARKDLNAMTMTAFLAASEGNDTFALRWLLEVQKAADELAVEPLPPTPSTSPPSSGAAEQLPSARMPKFELEARALIALGAICSKKGDAEKAEEVFRTAAYELDNAIAYARLAMLLPPGSEEREACLLKAIASGHPELGVHVAEYEWERAIAAAGRGKKKLSEAYVVLRDEWIKLAGSGSEQQKQRSSP